MVTNFKMGTSLGFLLVGVGVGAAFALLYAPDSGVRTRRKIVRNAQKAKDQLDDMKDTVCDRVTDWVEQGTERMEGLKKRFG